MSSGGSKTPKNQEIVQSTIPKFAEPYAMDMLGRAQDLSYQPYTPYQGERVAGFSGLQNQAFTGVGGMQTSPQTDAASGLAGLAGARAGMMGYTPTNLQQYQMGPADRVGSANWTDTDVSQNYMSPYMQNVVNAQQREAVRQADIAGTKRGFGAATSGAFGGSRHAIENAEANRNLSLQLGDIQAKGLQDAYTQGAAQFNQDQGRGLQAGMANQQAGLTVGQNNLNALLGVQDLAERANQFGAGYGMDALKQQLAAAGVLGGLGNDYYNQQLGIYGAQNEMGTQQQEYGQRLLDVPYTEFLNELNYPYQQMGYVSNLLRGLPTDQSSKIYGYPNTTAQNIAGAGGLASLYMANKGG